MTACHSVEVLVPVYRTELRAAEQFSVDRTVQILGRHGITFLAPVGLDTSYYANRYPGSLFRFEPAHYFQSAKTYSRLLVSEGFYAREPGSEFLLIVQPDVYIFRDELEKWLQMPFDYIGAPWPNGIDINVAVGRFAKHGGKATRAYVGNGGFSLRRRKKCLKLIQEHHEIAQWFIQTGSNEDLFFSFIGTLTNDFIIPNQITAASFSWEVQPEHYYALLDGALPMGAHAYEKYSPEFWQSHIPRR
jgi:hypothetical protein